LLEFQALKVKLLPLGGQRRCNLIGTAANICRNARSVQSTV